ncbi:MAG: hypothetical protein ACRDDM_11535 [Paraclostridium sp.]
MERVGFYLSDEELEYLDDYKSNNHLSSRNKAIRTIIKEHQSTSEIPMQNMYEFISKQIAKELEGTLECAITNKLIDTLKPQLNSLKYGTNATNKYTQILLELMNGIYYKESYGAIPTIDSLPSMAYDLSKKYVEGKIEKQHYKNSNTVD